MGKLVQISTTSKSKVFFLKKKGYKNKEIANRLGVSEASACRILKRNKEHVTLPLMKVAGFGKRHQSTNRKIRRLLLTKQFLSLKK